MFGKLTLSAIPYHDPIVMGAVVGSVLAGAAVLGLITYFRQWPVLWKEWLTSVDHKKIGIMYIILALVMLLRGFADALMMRAQQAMAMGASQGFLPPDHFNQVFSAHGTIMILFMAMPFLAGLMNIVVPQQIGARDVAFPFLNAVSLWLSVAGALLVMVSLGVGEFSKAGWSGYSPLTELEYSPDTGVDYWIWSLQIAGLGTLLSGVNFLVTVLTMRAPGMTLMRLPLFTWTTVFTNVLVIFSFPVLTAALALVSLDRYLGFHFFSNDLGGNMMMYANLFWTWGHPEVYIVILPAFGIFSEVVSTFSRKKLFGYTSLVYATAAIMFLSFAVWVHHFFTMGASAGVNIAFGISTMLIAVPTGVKVFNWLFTMYKGRVSLTTPMLWTIGFLTTFVLGGLAGVLLSIPPADYVLHNSLFLIAHFHNMLVPGTLFGFLAGYAYWFPKAVGFKLDETWGKRSFWCWLVGFYLAFVPLYMLGFMGMPRRMQHYDNPDWQPYLIAAGLGTLIIACGIGCMLVQLLVSFINREANRDVSGDPWDGRTLEWATHSPPAPYNFAVIPTVRDIDAFWDMKQRGEAFRPPAAYEAIEMPKNCAHGFLLGILAFLFGFAMIWHIWWLAVAGFLGLLAVVVARSMNDDTTEIIPAAEVARIEDLYFKRLAAAGRS
ncbi:cytochrome o ubiquinol oxidase subunit I [Solidesulfovibrio sp.]|uniref:cytochrome o ubiquinol oxidase subunit I n=1 Tax=Solidesulfovibrio sp. TaxID=2910990 RepID=UPI002614EA4B|nr:cytochrome o ubiquinol oxidase subunit I [Solidesulfovibrio sp.]